MRKQLLAVLLIVSIASLAARLAFGSCYLAPLEVSIRGSETILIGTVVARKQAWLAGTIVTNYQLNHVRYMEGDGPSDSLILVQRVDYDEPEFKVGERYVIRAGRDGDIRRAYGCQTPYTVRPDSSGSEPVIYKSVSPLIEFSDSTMVWGVGPHGEPKAGQMEIAHGIFLRRDDGARVTESEFIEILTRIIRRSGEGSK